MRERDKERARERRRQRKAQGICIQCGKMPAETGLSRCIKCLEYMRLYKNPHAEPMKRERISKGLCIRCGEPAVKGIRLCVSCNEKRATYEKRRYENLTPEKRESYLRRARERRRIYQQANRVKVRQQQVRYHRQTREKVLAHYGGKCACCGETRFEFLTIDHVKNNGSEHRRSIGNSLSKHMAKWLIKNGFPPGFQVLCWNCNMAKAFHEKCPHKLDRDED